MTDLRSFLQQCAEFQVSFENDLLLPIEDLIELLRHPVFEGLDLLLLTIRHRGHDFRQGRPVPTLSAYRCPDGMAGGFDSLERIFNFLGTHFEPPASDVAPTLDHVLRGAESVGYVPRATLARVVVLSRGRKSGSARALRQLASAFQSFSQNSVNLLNESYDIAIAEWQELRKRLRPSSHLGLESFCEFILERYGLRTYPHELAGYPPLWSSLGQVPESEPDRLTGLVRSLTSQIGSRKPFYWRRESKYYLLIPFVPRRAQSRRRLRYCILACSDTPIKRYVVDNLVRFIDLYFNEFLEVQRSKHLAELREATLALHLEVRQQPFTRRAQVRQRLAKFSHGALSNVVETTNAFSATLRLFEFESQTLKREAMATGADVRATRSNSETERIPVNQLNSVNAQTFRQTRKGRHRYEPNLATSALRHREGSASELCMPLFFKDTKLGTVNFESPELRGFDDDISYITQVVGEIENFVALLFESNDKYWLARRSRYEQNVHELSNLISRAADLPEHYREQIRGWITQTAITGLSDAHPLEELEKFRNTYWQRSRLNLPALGELETERIDTYERGTAVVLRNPLLCIPAYQMSLLKLIYKNLLDNYQDHGNRLRDKLIVRHRGVGRPVEFNVVSSHPIPHEKLEAASLAPIASHDPQKGEHSGLLIVGVLARHLGGFVHLGNLPRTTGIGLGTQEQFRMVVTVPISEVESAR